MRRETNDVEKERIVTPAPTITWGMATGVGVSTSAGVGTENVGLFVVGPTAGAGAGAGVGNVGVLGVGPTGMGAGTWGNGLI